MRTRLAAVAAVALILAACAGGEAGGTGPDLDIDRRIGYAVVVDQLAGSIEIGFSADRDASSGEAFDLTTSLWREGDGPWNEPPVTCIGVGRRVELGITSVQEATRPGLLSERVVWVSCLEPTDR
jgi:hypothetical protein